MFNEVVQRLLGFYREVKGFFRELKASLKGDWSLFIFFIGLPLLLSIPLYYAECGQENAKIHSIFEALYVTWITLTTVGYGDLYPVTWWGRIIVSIDAAFGIILFGLVIYHITRARDQK